MWLILISQSVSVTTCNTRYPDCGEHSLINLPAVSFLGGWLWPRSEKHMVRSPFWRLFCFSSLILAGSCQGWIAGDCCRFE